MSSSLNLLKGETLLREANKHGVDPLLLAAIILTESGGDRYATRVEEGFYRRYIRGRARSEIPGYWPPLSRVSDLTERWHRSTSWGLFQLMGQTARELGFKETFLAELCDPEVNIALGVQLVANLQKRHPSREALLLRYNGGSDAEYPSRVKKKIETGEARALLGRWGVSIG